MRQTLEIWNITNNPPRCLITINDPVTIPQVGQTINVRRADYKITEVDYAIDDIDGEGKTFRTNVYVRFDRNI